ncbi:MAG: MFS transporter [Candidatus Lokiarchaeota archaeon]|nr:MFS transporter [Candidatus Lokiarchaeota archaeon]
MTEERTDQVSEGHNADEVHIVAILNLSVVTFLVLLGLSMVAPILPEYAESFDVSYTLVGFVISSFAIARVFIDIPAGLLSYKYNKKRIMISGLILIAVSSVLAGWAPIYEVLIFARIIEGAGSALYVTAATVYLAQIASKKERGKWMSLYMGLLLLGSIFGPTFGGILAEIYDIHAPFFAYAIIATITIIPTITLPYIPESGEIIDYSPRKIIKDIGSVLRYPSYLIATFATFTLFFIRTGIRSTLVPLFAGNNLGLGSSEIGLILTFAGIATTLVVLPIGSISDRIGRRNPLILCLVLTAIVTVFLPYSTDMLALTIFMAIYGATTGLSGPMVAYVTDVSPEDKLEVSLGLYRTIGDLGFVVGPTVLGLIADETAIPIAGAEHSGLIVPFPFLIAVLLMLITALVLTKGQNKIFQKKE